MQVDHSVADTAPETRKKYHNLEISVPRLVPTAQDLRALLCKMSSEYKMRNWRLCEGNLGI